MKIRSKMFSMAAGVSLALTGLAPVAQSRGAAEHVLVVVWDGMRPDFITPQYTPNLYRLATNGVFFKNHHPAYISSTEVNGTALATGVHPARSGIYSNNDYRPEINWLSNFGTESLDAVRRGDLLTGGHYLLSPTLAEMLHEAGMRTVIAGAKPVVLLHDRASTRPNQAAKDSALLFAGKTIPRSLEDSLKTLNDDKAFPGSTTYPNTGADTWTTKSFLQGLWKSGVPKFSLLWLSEPDKSQHETGVGSPTSITAIDGSDQRLKEVLDALEERKLREKTDVFVVSDHGFSTVNQGPDVADLLNRRGFHASTKLENPEPGDVLVIGLGGAASLYVFDRDEAVIRRLAEFFQTSDFAGVIFSRLPIEGTFPMDRVKIDLPKDGPDLVVSLRWTGDKNDHGAPGLLAAVEGKKGKGQHSSLSPFDMHNTLVASGPDFKRGFSNRMPSGNIDLVPTVLWILGVQPSQPLDGRVLHEALATSKETPPKPAEHRIEASRETGLFRWRQYLKYTEIGSATYFDEGNGEAVLK